MSNAPRIDRLEKNIIKGGNFDFWQRAISGSTGYVADRFLGLSGVESYTREAAIGLAKANFMARITRTTASSGELELATRIEQRDILMLEGEQVTLSFQAKTTSGTPEIKVRVASAASGVDNFATVSYEPTQSLGNTSTSFQKFTYTFTVDSAMANNGLQINIGDESAVGPVTFDIAQVMLNEGTEAGEFNRAGKDIAEEFHMLQRYYEKSYEVDTLPGSAVSFAGVKIITNPIIRGNFTGVENTHFKVEKRAIPTFNTYSFSGTINNISNYDTGTNFGAVGYLSISSSGYGFTQNSGGNMPVGNYSYHYVADAEL